MNLVVDASVAIKWFVEENMRNSARQILVAGHDLAAPDLLIVELANVAWKKAVRKEISPWQAEIIPGECRRNLQLYASTNLIDRAIGIALHLKRPVYDCLYLACAEIVGSGVVTADRRFLGAVKGTPFAPRVIDLDSLASG